MHTKNKNPKTRDKYIGRVAAFLFLAILIYWFFQEEIAQEELKKAAIYPISEYQELTGILSLYENDAINLLLPNETTMEFTVRERTKIIGESGQGRKVKVKYLKPLDLERLPNATEVSVQAGYDDIEIPQIVKTMTLEEKVGQLFFARCPSVSELQDIERYKLGAYILFANDFAKRDPKTVMARNEAFQKQSKYPMFIGVDEEGGTVNRISRYKKFRDVPFASPQETYISGVVTVDTLEKAELLKSIGINVNFAPVCDVSLNPQDFIYPRTLGKDAATVSEYVKTVVEVSNASGIASVLKHFPGYGGSVDTHKQRAVDSRSLEAFRNSDLKPFEAGISSGADFVLISHNIIETLDPKNPASLSKPVHELLRDELDFPGVIITDDLVMDAIGKYYESGEAAVQAILAGNDMLCSTEYKLQIPAVIEAVRENRIPIEQMDKSVMRVLEVKRDLKLM